MSINSNVQYPWCKERPNYALLFIKLEMRNVLKQSGNCYGCMAAKLEDQYEDTNMKKFHLKRFDDTKNYT